VARDQGQARVGQLAVDNVEVGAAEAAGVDLQQNLPWAGPRSRLIAEFERPAGCRENHRPHGNSVADPVRADRCER
jgi:hypothetical protein